MRVFLKAIVAILTLAIGVALGIFLLKELEVVNIIVFVLACHAAGNIVYKLLRRIDKKFSRKSNH